MIRLERSPEGLVLAQDKTQTARGFYLCPEKECLRKAQKKLGIQKTETGRLNERIEKVLS
jgi:predicted RNA-binding protein YlxR (DUF448 family)